MTFRLLSLTRFPLAALSVAVLVLAMSCASQEGDVCFADGDCAGSLVCCKSGMSTSERGRCGAESSCATVIVGDSGVDAGVDAGTDGGMTSDAMTPDDAGADAGETDGGPMTDGAIACTVGGATCGDGYCQATACGTTGTCASRPESCPGVLSPVCGCDDETYLSACEAARAGVNVRASGACSSTTPDAGSTPDGG